MHLLIHFGYCLAALLAFCCMRGITNNFSGMAPATYAVFSYSNWLPVPSFAVSSCRPLAVSGILPTTTANSLSTASLQSPSDAVVGTLSQPISSTSIAILSPPPSTIASTVSALGSSSSLPVPSGMTPASPGPSSTQTATISTTTSTLARQDVLSGSISGQATSSAPSSSIIISIGTFVGAVPGSIIVTRVNNAAVRNVPPGFSGWEKTVRKVMSILNTFWSPLAPAAEANTSGSAKTENERSFAAVSQQAQGAIGASSSSSWIEGVGRWLSCSGAKEENEYDKLDKSTAKQRTGSSNLALSAINSSRDVESSENDSARDQKRAASDTEAQSKSTASSIETSNHVIVTLTSIMYVAESPSSALQRTTQPLQSHRSFAKAHNVTTKHNLASSHYSGDMRPTILQATTTLKIVTAYTTRPQSELLVAGPVGPSASTDDNRQTSMRSGGGKSGFSSVQTLPATTDFISDTFLFAPVWPTATTSWTLAISKVTTAPAGSISTSSQRQFTAEAELAQPAGATVDFKSSAPSGTGLNIVEKLWAHEHIKRDAA